MQASAGLNRLSRQAELVARLEGLLFSKLLRKIPRRLLSMLLRQALLRTSRWNLQICIKPNDPRERRIPKDIMTSIYKLVAERRDRNQSFRRKRNKKNLHLFKDSIDEKIEEEVELRTNVLRNLRNRTISEQPNQNVFSKIQLHPKKSNDILLNNLRNQVNDVNVKVDNLQLFLIERLNELSHEIRFLKTIRK